MSVPDNSQPGQKAQPRACFKATSKATLEDPNATIQEQLAIAKARRARAEMARQKITSEIIEATRELYQKLVSEGEQTLEKAKQQDVESELKHLEAQSELERAQRAKAEADAYLEKAIAQAQQQAREILEQAQAIKAEATAFREKLLVQAQQAQAELDRAQAARVEADAYREKVLAETQQQAREILRQAHLTVERETAETRRQHATDSEPILARPRPIKAAPEQLETQRQRSQDASLETEFKPKEGSKRVRTRPGNRKSSTAGSPRPKTLSSLLNGPAKDASPLNSDQGNPQSGDNRAVSAGIPEICNPPLASSGILEATVSKKRPAKNELVVGLELDGRAKAYPVRLASGSKIINDDLAGEDVVVVFGPPAEPGIAFKRCVDGRSLTFAPLPEAANGLMLMKDQETGTTWEALSGRGISGDLASKELQRLTSEYSFWFAWLELHPDTEVCAW